MERACSNNSEPEGPGNPRQYRQDDYDSCPAQGLFEGALDAEPKLNLVALVVSSPMYSKPSQAEPRIGSTLILGPVGANRPLFLLFDWPHG